MTRSCFTVLGLAAALALGGCATQQQGGPGPGAKPAHAGMQGGGMGSPGHHGMMGGPGMPMPGAMAKLSATQGNKATGVAIFHERGGQLMMHARVTGLTPNTEHGFHIHERGDCSAPDATSAGGHFNPLGHQHGNPMSPERHAGDLPNLRADERGNAEMRLALAGLNLSGANPLTILDKSLVVHANADDYRSQPAGNSGGRIACGVISQPVPPPR